MRVLGVEGPAPSAAGCASYAAAGGLRRAAGTALLEGVPELLVEAPDPLEGVDEPRAELLALEGVDEQLGPTPSKATSGLCARVLGALVGLVAAVDVEAPPPQLVAGNARR